MISLKDIKCLMMVLFLNLSTHRHSAQILIGRQCETKGIGTSVMGRVTGKDLEREGDGLGKDSHSSHAFKDTSSLHEYFTLMTKFSPKCNLLA